RVLAGAPASRPSPACPGRRCTARTGHRRAARRPLCGGGFSWRLAAGPLGGGGGVVGLWLDRLEGEEPIELALDLQVDVHRDVDRLDLDRLAAHAVRDAAGEQEDHGGAGGAKGHERLLGGERPVRSRRRACAASTEASAASKPAKSSARTSSCATRTPRPDTRTCSVVPAAPSPSPADGTSSKRSSSNANSSSVPTIRSSTASCTSLPADSTAARACWRTSSAAAASSTRSTPPSARRLPRGSSNAGSPPGRKATSTSPDRRPL